MTATPFPSGPGWDKPSISMLEGLNARLTSQMQRAWELSDRARVIADDVFGPAGAQGSGGSTEKGPQALGRFSALASSLDSLDFALSALSGQVDRLSCV